MQDNTRQGVLAGGNWIIDQIKMIEGYPKEERLATIRGEKESSGGAPFNVLKALYRMGASFPLEGVGILGNDDKGEKILRECAKAGINTTQMRRLREASTSYTDVMTVASTGKRTFFHYRGANDRLDTSCFDFTHTSARIFHLGYLLLLDGLDKIDTDGMTGASIVLKKAKNAGLLTSVDVVSEQSGRYQDVINSSLPYVDLFFSNEFEAQMLTGVNIANNKGGLDIGRAYQAAEKILAGGVMKWVIIHSPQGVVAMSKRKERIFQAGIDISEDKIRGAVGAGDALAAGVLYGIHENWDMQKSLLFGVNVAAASLMDVTASESIRSVDEYISLKET